MASKQKLARGLATVFGTCFALTLSVNMLVGTFRTEIDNALGTVSKKTVTNPNADTSNAYNYKSTYKSTTELVKALADVGERMSEEGTVLLKNANNALPLSDAETKKVTLLGINSYYPIQGGMMGSSVSKNTGTDADTTDLVGALTARGYTINQTVADAYNAAKENYKTEVRGWTGSTTYYGAVSPTNFIYSDKEVPTSGLDAVAPTWKSSMSTSNVIIVTISRWGSENNSYLPGTAGVDPTQNLNQKDPLGLSDHERDLIKAAIAAKGSNGKVIVFVNSSSAMELGEVKNDTGVDAIMQIGDPGAYGFYGIADLLRGKNPDGTLVDASGHLPDTYAVCQANSPAAQNYGRKHWANYDTLNATGSDTQGKQINSYLVEAEGIYTGYKYYETRYDDVVANRNNASSSTGASNGATAWAYANEVAYPFGYGLSYTTFTQTLNSVAVDLAKRTVTASVTVKNTGSRDGKSVVQLYVALPYIQGGIEKSAIQLLDYDKVALTAGQSKTITITADAQYMASWDSKATGIAGDKGTYVLDAGTYYFAIGDDAHNALNNVLANQGYAASLLSGTGDAAKVKTWSTAYDAKTFGRAANGTIVSNHLDDADLNYYQPNTVTYLSRSDWKGTFPTAYDTVTANEAMIKVLLNDLTEIKADSSKKVVFGESNNLSLSDLKGVTDITDIRWTQLMNQIKLAECLERIALGGTSCKAIESIGSPVVMQNDGPNGYNSYTLGVNSKLSADPTKDPYFLADTDKNYNFKDGIMGNATIIGSTFSKEMAKEYGEVTGNYSIWSHCTILWGSGSNLHRLPYNARNHEYFSEDPILTGYQGANFILGGNEFGAIISPKHLAFNDTEIDRGGVAPFMTEQKARETELRGFQIQFEDGQALGCMTTFSRIGCTAVNSHYGVMMNILRDEWGFKGMISTDMATNRYYFSVKECANCGVTMTTQTSKQSDGAWSYWTEDNVAKDSSMCYSAKQCMLWQNYAIANSNAMNGLVAGSTIENVRTWYDNVILGLQIGFGTFTAAAIAFAVVDALKKKGAVDSQEAK